MRRYLESTRDSLVPLRSGRVARAGDQATGGPRRGIYQRARNAKRSLSAHRPKPRPQCLVVQAQPLPLLRLVRLRRAGRFWFAPEFALVDGGNEVAEGVEGVVFLVDWG